MKKIHILLFLIVLLNLSATAQKKYVASGGEVIFSLGKVPLTTLILPLNLDGHHSLVYKSNCISNFQNHLEFIPALASETWVS
ncbi:MAG: hypothetical protein LH473_10470 [Chitinophagales bacterium]|nr:hypothetical protein [Chitinophagales bacterium]